MDYMLVCSIVCEVITRHLLHVIIKIGKIKIKFLYHGLLTRSCTAIFLDVSAAFSANSRFPKARGDQ